MKNWPKLISYRRILSNNSAPIHKVIKTKMHEIYRFHGNEPRIFVVLTSLRIHRFVHLNRIMLIIKDVALRHRRHADRIVGDLAIRR